MSRKHHLPNPAGPYGVVGGMLCLPPPCFISALICLTTIALLAHRDVGELPCLTLHYANKGFLKKKKKKLF